MKLVKKIWIALCAMVLFMSAGGVVNAQEVNPFADVKEKDWYYSYSLYAYEYGIMKGKGQDDKGLILFDPHTSITRAEFVQILYNREGKPNVEITTAFQDVKEGAWYAKAISWAAENNIVAGKGNRFDVDSPITRQEMATVLYKYANSYWGYDTSGRAEIKEFTDASQVADWATDYMKWAVHYGIMKGKGDKLDPVSSATRAESVTMLKNFIDTYIGEISYSAPQKEHIVLDGDSGNYYVDNQVLITAKDGITKEEVAVIVEKLGGIIIGSIEITNDYQAEFSKINDAKGLESIIKQLKADEAISKAYKHELFEMEYEAIPNDAEWVNEEWSTNYPEGINWGMEAINAMGAWNYLGQMSPVNVGIIDGGFDEKHEDLDFQKVWNNPGSNVSNHYDHGTHVAGIIGAKYNNNIGTAGVAPKVSLYAYSMWDELETGKEDTNGMTGLMEWKYALANLITANCKVINVSMAKFDNPEVQAEAFGVFLNKLLVRGYDFVIVQAAGNESKESTISGLFTGITLPEVKDRVIVVGAIGTKGSHTSWLGLGNRVFDGYYFADFSNYGDRVDVLAPGVKIFSTLPGNTYSDQRWDAKEKKYKEVIGTSMAAPHVSGVVAMCYSVNPDLTGKQVKEIIVKTASVTVKDTNSEHPDKEYKLVDADAAVELAVNTTGDVKVPAEASKVIVMGTVASDIQQAGIEDVSISVYKISNTGNTEESVYQYASATDAEGNYELFLVPGEYSISFYKEGYLPHEIEKVIVSTDPVIYVNKVLLSEMIAYNNHYYKVYSGKYTWTEAKAECEKMGGYLVTITSAEEQAFIESINDKKKWIGGYRDDSYNWYWVTGETWDYTNWGSGEPNNSSNVVSNEKYATVWPREWNDLADTNRSEQTGFICEWGPVN